MTLRPCAPVLAGLLALVCLSLRAEEAPTELEPVVVTARGHAVPARDVLPATIVIGREEIARSLAGDLSDLLRFHAGIDVARTGGPGQPASAFIRGGESNHTLVLVDGVRMNPGTSGGAALQHLSPAMIERIEIVKGPRGTLYGSDAIGGVINIVTRAPAGSAAEAVAEGGSDETLGGSLFLAQGDERRGAALQVGSLRTSGFPTCRGSSVPQSYERTTVNLQGRMAFDDVRVTSRVWNAQGNTEYNDFCAASFKDADFTNRVVAVEATGGGDADWTLRLSEMLDEQRQNQSADFVRTRRPAASATGTFVNGIHRYSLGLDAAREEVDALQYGAPTEADRGIYGGHVQYEFDAGPHAALLSAGAMHYQSFGAPALWNAEYGYEFATATRLTVAASRGFRAPDATDRFGFGGNPDVRPERARSIEAGLSQALGEAQRIELRAFRNDVTDLISVECVQNCTDPDFFNDVYQALNVDRFRNDGVELSYRAAIARTELRIAAQHQDPRSEARADPCSGQARLCRRANDSLGGSVTQRLGSGYLALDALGVGDRLDFGGARLPGYAVFGLGAGVELPQGLRLSLRVENLLDRHYETVSGFNSRDRSFFVSASLHL